MPAQDDNIIVRSTVVLAPCSKSLHEIGMAVADYRVTGKKNVALEFVQERLQKMMQEAAPPTPVPALPDAPPAAGGEDASARAPQKKGENAGEGKEEDREEVQAVSGFNDATNRISKGARLQIHWFHLAVCFHLSDGVQAVRGDRAPRLVCQSFLKSPKRLGRAAIT